MTKRHRLALSLTERSTQELKFLCEHFEELQSPMIRKLINEKYKEIQDSEKLKQH